MSLSWGDAQRVTQGQLGVMRRTVCPFCSHTRRKKKDRCFAVTLKEPAFAVWNCVHCGSSGYIWPDIKTTIVGHSPADQRQARREGEKREADDRARRTANALKVWREAERFTGSPADVYLRDTRGIGDWLDMFDVDQVLRFHPRCWFGSGLFAPCMIALVTHIRSNEPIAIHRTYLSDDRRPQRIDRKCLGPLRGGGIMFGEVTDQVVIGEGIESTLSASKILGIRPAWSMISRSGIERFSIPKGLKRVTVAADLDDSGDGQKSAIALVSRLTGAGIEAYIAAPKVGKDFNDTLMHQRGAQR